MRGVWILEENEVSWTSCRDSLSRAVIVLLSGEFPFFSWAAGSLFTSIWTEPKKIADTWYLQYGFGWLLCFWGGFLGRRGLWDLALLKHWKDWRMESWLLVLWKPLFTEVTKGEILVHSRGWRFSCSSCHWSLSAQIDSPHTLSLVPVDKCVSPDSAAVPGHPWTGTLYRKGNPINVQIGKQIN